MHQVQDFKPKLSFLYRFATVPDHSPHRLLIYLRCLSSFRVPATQQNGQSPGIDAVFKIRAAVSVTNSFILCVYLHATCMVAITNPMIPCFSWGRGVRNSSCCIYTPCEIYHTCFAISIINKRLFSGYSEG